MPDSSLTLDASQIVAYQGEPGAYSHLACKHTFPDWTSVNCATFADALHRVEQGDAFYAMIPVENSTAGRVEEIYRELRKTQLFVVKEHFEPVNHCLIARDDMTLDQVTRIGSHPQALAQCDGNIKALGVKNQAMYDTAGAAKHIAEQDEPGLAVISSELAAELYGLKVLQPHFNDTQGNTTRFLVFSRQQKMPVYESEHTYITSFMFRVRNMPAALYKAMGGFATQGINMLKLESYMVNGNFTATQFYVDVEAHFQAPAMQAALEELRFFSEEVRILGTYLADEYRLK
ncbi:prephenate dehydratase [Marinomonas posidonica]|uniref:prephenate dehydratase n=1 Tax=Marinomonas posidonica (strain CECT 7376 / NCIMB 14433 / IVIA-Po-181) TaxID=491952 RepID=F6CU55_MARPP|nr:prephenate dehydratase [Marinomonas posidonica]AEF54107.1 Prephenate dehydratase [Marinomonas posidonica IVIA-Po-181]